MGATPTSYSDETRGDETGRWTERGKREKGRPAGAAGGAMPGPLGGGGLQARPPPRGELERDVARFLCQAVR